MNRSELLRGVRRSVVKVGSSVLTRPDGQLDEEALGWLCEDLARLSAQREIVLVSSGAIAFGAQRLGLRRVPEDIVRRQAIAALGQVALMWHYERLLGPRGRPVAQVLLTQDDLSSRRRFLNARNTLRSLLRMGALPVINENDSVVVREIKLGDNDNLAAAVTALVEAELLVILTDVEGLLGPDGRVIPRVEVLDGRIEGLAGGASRPTRVGGMVTKLQAIRKVSRFGVPTVIASGKRPGVLEAIFRGEEVGTLFLPQGRLPGRKRWIAFALRPKGELVVDPGAKEALCRHGRSLLPSGVLEVRGRFERGDPVSCLDPEGREFARGLVNYSAQELQRIKGLRTDRIEHVLGYKYRDEVIHRDDLVLL